MVHERYEKKCGTWSHRWVTTKTESIGKHGNPCTSDKKTRVYESCEKCGGARKRVEKVKAPGHRMRPINDAVMKGDDGYLVKIRVLACANECGYRETKQIGKKWKP